MMRTSTRTKKVFASVANRWISPISGHMIGGATLFSQASVLFRELKEETDARRPSATYED